MEVDEPTPLWISALEHFEYCPRQFALMYIDGTWSDNAHVVRGERFHRRVDSGLVSTKAGTTTIRGLEVWSDALGLTGRCDAVEIDGSVITPVEYKAGRRHGLTADVQVCAQSFCLEEMLDTTIDEAYIYYGAHRRRQRVHLNDELRTHTLAVIESAHRLIASSKLPSAPADERCRECQLLGICMPSVCNDAPSAGHYLVAQLEQLIDETGRGESN